MNEAYIRHMAERQSRLVEGNFDNRNDYHFFDGAAEQDLKIKAFETVDGILRIDTPTGHSGRNFYAKDGAAIRNLLIHYVEPDDENEIFVSGSDIIDKKNPRRFALTSVTIRDESYFDERRETPLTNRAECTVREKIENQGVHFLTNYLLERFSSGEIVATISGTDSFESPGTYERRMSPYDFDTFARHMAIAAGVRMEPRVRAEKEGEEA